jgi:hypothetical protein
MRLCIRHVQTQRMLLLFETTPDMVSNPAGRTCSQYSCCRASILRACINVLRMHRERLITVIHWCDRHLGAVVL